MAISANAFEGVDASGRLALGVEPWAGTIGESELIEQRTSVHGSPGSSQTPAPPSGKKAGTTFVTASKGRPG
jgi:hypothetical protein